MPVQYDRSPVVEAIFEFFVEGASIPPNVAGQIFEKLQKDYAGKRDEQVSAAEIDLGPSGPRVRTAKPRHRLWRTDGTALAQFAEDMFAFNALRPYTHYADYSEQIARLFQLYTELAQPSGFRFLGQRYINLVTLPSHDAHPADYFSIYPRIRREGRIFAAQIQTHELANGTVVLNLAFQGSDADDRPTYALDLYARTVRGGAVPVEWAAVKSWHDTAHAAILEAFEVALTRTGAEYLGRVTNS